jgi:hypothetical protein
MQVDILKSLRHDHWLFGSHGLVLPRVELLHQEGSQITLVRPPSGIRVVHIQEERVHPTTDNPYFTYQLTPIFHLQYLKDNAELQNHPLLR